MSEKVTNEMRYKTAEERIAAFGEFCKNEFCNQCSHLDCRLYKQGRAILHCYDGWLALEAKEEKPEPCPFCGSSCTVHKGIDMVRPHVSCDSDWCGYKSAEKPTIPEAIAEHNRVARAVRAANNNNN